MKPAVFFGFWLAIALAAVLALVMVSADYQNTVLSLQDFRWAVATFERPTPVSTTVNLILEVQNPSGFNIDFKDLDVYVWLNGATVGKTYTPFGTRSVPAHSKAQLPLTIVVDNASLSDATRAGGGGMFWRATGTYKARAPFADGDFYYQLSLDIGT